MKRSRFLRYLGFLSGFAFLKPVGLLAFPGRTRSRFLNKVKFVWTGGITAAAARVRAKLSSATILARLVVSSDPLLANPVYSAFATADATNNYVVPLAISGLQPDTEYYYGIEADGVVDMAADAIGRFRTMADGPQSFRFTVASCNFNSNHPVFYRIKEKNPLLHITHGDLHYSDANSATDINVHRAPLENTILQPALKELLRDTPMAYVWDDHDYCGDNTTATAAGRTNARLAYQEYVPHYPLPAGSGNVPIYQAFTVGRVRFILTDLRSEKGVSGTTMMGAAQKAWFKAECLAAKNNNHLIVWINSTPWGGSAETDSWAGYEAERTELSDFFKATAIQNLLIICGDIHMLALDDGSHYDFSTGAGNPFKYPLLQAAAVNQSGSYRGGTYSHGYFLNPSRQHGQYAALDVTDNGGSSLSVTLTGYRVDSTGVESVLLTHTVSFPVPGTLPLNILSFTVAEGPEPDTVMLRWETAANTSYQTVVERSDDGQHFTALRLESSHALTSAADRFTFTDTRPLNGKGYYRIKLIGHNGEVVYSPIGSIIPAPVFRLTVLVNPVRQHLYLRILAPAAEAASYTLADGAGRTLRQQGVLLTKGENRVVIDLVNQPPGLYFFQLHTRRGTVSKRFVRRQAD